MVRSLVLGSGQDGALPQFGSTNPADTAARMGQLAERTASSLVIELDSGSLLLDASPDLRRQDTLRVFAGFPPITDVALTHAHMGHYTGLVHFGREASNAQGVRLWVTAAMAYYLSTNQPWRCLLDDGHLVAHVVDPGVAVRVDGHSVRFLPVKHRAEFSDTVGISVDGSLLYLPDVDAWEGFPNAEDVISSHEVALLDATFYDADEIPGRGITDIPHPLVTETVARFGDLADQIVLTHLNHSNALCDPDSESAEAVTAQGFRIASDGMAIT